MNGAAPACPVCGGTEYYHERGFYYCNECQTQSQEIREEVYDNETAPARRGTTLKQKKTKIVEVDENEWTSWELHNFVLSGMVEELISLGASKEIKVVVLQLWATYLKKIEAAFTSRVKDMKLPKLGITYTERDARLLYNKYKKKKQEKKKKRQKKNEADSQISASSPADVTLNVSGRINRSQRNKTRRELIKADYAKSYGSSDLDNVSSLNENLNISTTSKSMNINRSIFSRAAREDQLLKSSALSTCSSTRGYNPKILTRKCLIAIIYLALLITEDKIQLSDILRWIEDGNLSFYEISHFLPNDQKLKGVDIISFGLQCHKLTYVGLSRISKDMALFLDVYHIPLPNLLSLVKRYIEELQLPVCITDYAEKLMSISPLRDFFCPRTEEKIKTIPLFEAQAMAFIIVLLKLLLGLDGKTECMISTVTQKLNVKLHKRSSDVANLFVWTEWVKYIECRKTFLALNHFPLQYELFQHTIKDPNAYIEFWNRTKKKDDKRKRIVLIPKLRINPVLIHAMQSTLNKLEGNEEAVNIPEYVSSCTPQTTNLKLLSSSQPDFKSSKMGEILQQDFSHSTMRHLMYPQPYINLAKKEGLNITVRKKSASNSWRKLDIVERKKIYGNGMYRIISSESKNHKTEHEEVFGLSNLFPGLPLVAEKQLLDLMKRKKIKVKRLNKGNSKSAKLNGLPLNVNQKKKRNSSHGLYADEQELGSEVIEPDCNALYFPRVEYWFLESNMKDMTHEEFERDIACKLPASFLWLLKECARILHISTKDLYSEVLNIETVNLHIPMKESKTKSDKKISKTPS